MEGNPSEIVKFPEAQKSGRLMCRRVAWGLCVCCSIKMRIWKQPGKKTSSSNPSLEGSAE